MSASVPLSAPNPVCSAPWVNLHLRTSGAVHACCQNQLYELGRIPDQSLTEIWHGPRLAALRKAIALGDLGLGCEGCEHGIRSGERHLASAASYDGHRVDLDAVLPVRLELALSNTCNLQCVMCDGSLSSSIRSQREGRPPMPDAYDDRFFEDLARLAPSLEHVGFLGGEPFLARPSLRAMEVLAEHGFVGTCHVTTNGTIVNDRVASILDRLRVDIAISIDGHESETIEAIRIGVDSQQLRANVEWFRQRAIDRLTHLSFNYCLMTANAEELHPYLRWADSLDCDVNVLVVRDPLHLSVLHLPDEELGCLVDALDDQARSGLPLGRNLAVFEAQLAAARTVLEARRSGTAVNLALRQHSEATIAAVIGRLTADADASGVHEFVIDPAGVLLDVRPDPSNVVGVDFAPLLGTSMRDALAACETVLGHLTRTEVVSEGEGFEERSFVFERDGEEAIVRMVRGAAAGREPARSYLARCDRSD
jgi:MoaA/NifB/PqqE/SkfB family radical SAM enzyme